MSDNVKLYDVAREVGCSIATVSQVLKGRTAEARISAGLALRVRDAAMKLGYKKFIDKISADTILRNFIEWGQLNNRIFTLGVSAQALIDIYNQETNTDG